MNYERINWENAPSTDTPLDADNLNKMDEALDTLNREVAKTRSDVQEVEETAASLGSQIAGIIRLEDGSTTGDAELINGRVGKDGTTYSTIGDAIRGQIGDLRDHVIEVSDEEPEEFYNKIWVKDDDQEIEIPTKAELDVVDAAVDELNERLSFYDGITTIPFEYGGIYQGVETVDNHRIRCGYLIGYKDTKVSVKGQNAYQVGIQVFDANKAYVATSGWTKEYTLPNDCYYRIQLRKGTSDPEIVDSDFAELLASVDVDYPFVPYVSQLNSTIEEISGSASTNNHDISSVKELVFKGYITQQTETGYAYKNNVDVGSVVNIDTPVVAENTASLVVKNVTGGMRFKVFGNGAFNYLLWSWLDKDKKLISKAETWASSGANGVIITAPTNAVYLVCSSSIPYTYGFSAQYLGATVLLDDELSDVKTDVVNLTTDVVNLTTDVVNLTTKGYITQQTETGYAYKNNVDVGSVVNIDTPTSVADTASLVVKNITEGMRFKVFGNGAFNYLLWSWLDKDRKLISKANSWESSGSNGVIITAPTNAVYLVCSSSMPYTYGFSAQYLGATVLLDEKVSAIMDTFDFTKTNANLLKNADFSFDFFSDIHGGDVNFQRIIQHAEDNNVDVIINGGDTALRYLDDSEYSIDWYATDVNTSSVDILSAVGNHDVWTGAYWTKADATDVYDTFIKPLVTKFTGIVQPASAEENGLCYYYKDYGAIRVIVLNAMSGDQSVDFWDTTQATWFENVLADAKTNSKHVIVCNHSPFPKNIAQRDEKSNWNSWIDYRTDVSSDSIVIKTAALDLIKSFIDGGGIFICLLTGHEHVDSILTATGYDGQFMINIASAKWPNHPDGITYSSTSSQYYDCFNYCTVDSTHGILKLVRVGWDMDEALKERTVLSYDYFNHKLINE